jgi:hypothetical protein
MVPWQMAGKRNKNEKTTAQRLKQGLCWRVMWNNADGVNGFVLVMQDNRKRV